MIGFIGCGNMGSAMVERIASAGLHKPQELIVYDQDGSKTEGLQQRFGLQVAAELSSLCRDSQKIFLAVKPQDMPKLLLGLKDFLQAEHLLVTIAAGLDLSFYQEYVGKKQKIMRLMPNTPCLVGEGMIAACKNENVTREEEQDILSLLAPLGQVISLEETYFDAVTALSGSGPAYIMLLIEALADGGVELGLYRDVALKLASQTVLGAAKMCLTTGEHPAILKNRITSPGGTTSAGLLALETSGIRAAVINAVIAAARRSKEL